MERDTQVEKQREQGGHRQRNRKRPAERVQAASGVSSPAGGQAPPRKGRKGPCPAQPPCPRAAAFKFLPTLSSALGTSRSPLGDCKGGPAASFPHQQGDWGEDRTGRRWGARSSSGRGEGCGPELGSPQGGVGAWPACFCTCQRGELLIPGRPSFSQSTNTTK